MTKDDLDIIKTTKWECPAETGIPLITMPNIPKALHALPPRNIMGKTLWDKARKTCYYKADYKCEICGCSPDRGRLHAHELYSIDYKEGESEFKRCIAICKEDHDFIHSGRLLTLFKEGNVLYPKSYVLRVVEKGFKLVSEYNKEHPDDPLRVFDTFKDYLKVPEIQSEISELIQKYDIKFYAAPNHGAKWEDWHLLWGGRKYFTPYKNPLEWEEAMKKASKNDTARKVKDPFTGGVYDEMEKIINQND